MPRRAPLTLGRLVERLARLAPLRHRELVQGMLSELESIADPGERARFAVGAIAAIARLSLAGFGRAVLGAPSRWLSAREVRVGPFSGGLPMSAITTRRLLRRHARPFAVSFGLLTGILLANYALRQAPELSARGVPAGGIVEVLLMALPFTVALTIPMAVFLGASWAFTRLGRDGVLASALRERHGIRRLLAPVLGAAVVVATLTLASNAEVVPRANARLVAVLGGSRQPTDREMTVRELRAAAASARSAIGPDASRRAAGYEVEIQKKFALAAACVVLALAGAAIGIRFPKGGMGLVLGASAVLFPAYYCLVVTGESLADRQVVSPLVGMWTANAVFLAIGLLLVRRPGRTSPNGGAETLAIGG